MTESNNPPIYDTQQMAVFFSVVVDGQTHAAGISFEALANHFGATEEGAASVDAYIRHQLRIDKAVTRLVAVGVANPVMLTSKMF